MDVQITGTGRIFRQVDPTLVAILMEMFPAAIERYVKPANEPLKLPMQEAPAFSDWAYGVGMTPGGLYAPQRMKGSSVEYLDCAPEQIRKAWPDFPEHLVSRYAAMPEQERIYRQPIKGGKVPHGRLF